MIIKVLGDFTTMIDINVARMEKYGHNVDGPPILPPDEKGSNFIYSSGEL